MSQSYLPTKKPNSFLGSRVKDEESARNMLTGSRDLDRNPPTPEPAGNNIDLGVSVVFAKKCQMNKKMCAVERAPVLPHT